MAYRDYNQSLPRNGANHTALSPLSFLARSAQVYPDRLSVVHGATRYTWAQTYRRCRQLASALARRGTAEGPLALLAPLSGVTDLHMRRIARRLGASAVVSEMVAAAEVARGASEARLA